MNCEKCGAELPEGGGVCPKCKLTPRRAASVTLGYACLACLVGIFVLESLFIPLFAGLLIIFVDFCTFLLMPVALFYDLIGFIRRRDLIFALMLWSVSFAANHYLDEKLFIEEHGIHSSLAPTWSALRSMTIALETYARDLKRYPSWSLKKEENAFGGLRDKKGALARIPTFRLANGTPLATLTTPVGYLQSYLVDSFAPVKGATFGYWHDDSSDTTATSFIIWSPGPDKVYDLTIDNIAQAYDAINRHGSALLSNCTYDPTNGTVSGGDIYRVY